MAVKYGKFELPQKIILDQESATLTYARFTAEPFERGFGHTLGNSLRRVLLSSLEAPAIISIRMQGIPHEYIPIEGVVEDMVNIILNLKGALLRKTHLEQDSSPTSFSRIITSTVEVTREDLDKNKGQISVKLGDVFRDGNFEVVNPEMHLFTVTKPLKKQIDLRVAMGRGYVPSERQDIFDKTSDEILVDAAFSPVRVVNYYVENTRVRDETDLDKLILEITTDGRVHPVEALSFASQICVKHFDVFNKLKAEAISFQESADIGHSDEDELMEKLALRIDEIELSVRSTNCLSGANIETIAELVTIPERKMLEFRNFGKKSLNEIKAKLVDMNLHLGMDLSRFGITPDNVREKIRKFQEERKGKKERAKENENEE